MAEPRLDPRIRLACDEMVAILERGAAQGVDELALSNAIAERATAFLFLALKHRNADTNVAEAIFITRVRRIVEEAARDLRENDPGKE